MQKGDSGRLSALLHFRAPVSVCITRATLHDSHPGRHVFCAWRTMLRRPQGQQRNRLALYIGQNGIENEGAGALAEALKATLATLLASSAHTLIFWS